jgi:pimeloyl-ACP methyl ester carboxylesterase
VSFREAGRSLYAVRVRAATDPQENAMPIVARRLADAITGSPFLAALLAVVLAAASATIPAFAAAGEGGGPKPTVVLVHGAFAESASWLKVSSRLLARGYKVVAAANPLRSVKGDGAYVADLLDSIKDPVILVGHSYGGNVITVAATGRKNVKALVYVAGFAPEVGETAAGLSGKFPGSTLGGTLAAPVVLADGSKDLYIQQDKYHAQFAADVPAAEARTMATSQRPIAEAALDEPAASAAWKTIPSWFIRQQGQEHPAGGADVHGRACGSEGGGSHRGRLARRHDLPPRRTGEAHRARRGPGRALIGADRGSTPSHVRRGPAVRAGAVAERMSR